MGSSTFVLPPPPSRIAPPVREEPPPRGSNQVPKGITTTAAAPRPNRRLMARVAPGRMAARGAVPPHRIPRPPALAVPVVRRPAPLPPVR
jgi:hypothetical protein